MSLLRVFSVESTADALIVIPLGDSSGFRYGDVHHDTNSLVERISRDGVQYVVIDFCQVEVVGSVMISALIKLARATETQKGSAAFCNASPTMQNVIQSMNLTRLWPHYATRDEALQAIIV